MSDGAAPETLALLLDATRRFLAREVDPAAIEAAGRIPARVIEGAAEAGLFAITLPLAHGGLGLPLPDACALVAEIARVDRSVAIMVGLHAGLGTRALVRHGTAAQQARWLPSLARGACVASFAATEPNAGSDLQAIRTTARVEGDALRIDGEKAYVTNGGFAGLFTLLVRTPDLGGDRAFSLVCVPRDTPGLRVGPEEDKLGVRASSTVSVTLDGARVPREHLLGAPGAGMELAHETLAWGRLVMAAGCTGTARYARDASVAHVTARRQFRRAIGQFDAVRAQVAEMDATIFAMQSLVEHAARALERGTDAEALALSTAAKVFCSEGSNAICDQAIQLHGAMGFLEPTGVARALRDTRITRIFEGANDVLLVHLGALILGRRGAPAQGDASPELDRLDARRAGAAATYRESLGVRATQRQLLAQRLARAEVCSVAARASLLRARGEPEHAALADYAVDLLAREGHRQLDAIRHLDDDERAAARLSERAYAPFSLERPA